MPNLRRYPQCRDSSNCMRSTNGRCDCANGDATAISRTYEKQFERLFTCDETMCTQNAGNCNSLARSRAQSPND